MDSYRNLKQFMNDSTDLLPPALEPVKAILDKTPKIGRYDLIREVARGGTAIIYEALDTESKRRVALKVLTGNDIGLTALQRFHREAAVTTALKHPNIVPVYDVGSVELAGGMSIHFIAMDLIDGRTLTQVMPKLSKRERIQILEVVAKTVGYAHTHGVTHRDIKPENILMERGTPLDAISLSWRIYLTDFGLAKIHERSDLTRTGTVIGTVHYMAPEQVKGRTSETGPWTDVWSLGVLLYEMVTDRKPFDGAAPLEIYNAIARADPVSPGKLYPALHPDVETICLKALEKERDRRYPDGASFAEEVHRYLAEEPIHAQRPSVMHRVWKKVGAHPAISGLLTFACLALAAAIGWGVTQHFAEFKTRGLLLSEREEKERRGKVEDALKPASKLLDRWELDGKKLSAGEEQEVQETLAQVARLYPNAAPWEIEQGRWHWMKKEFAEAESRFTRTLDDAPVKFLGHYYRARVHIARYAQSRTPPLVGTSGIEDLNSETAEERRWRESALADLKDFQKSAVPDSKDRRIKFARGLALRYQATSKEEFLRAAQMLEASGESGWVSGTEAYSEAGTAYYYAGECEHAVRLYRLAIADGRNDARIWNLLGMALRADAQDAEALECFTRAVQSNNSSPVALFNRGLLYYARHEWGPAKTDLQQAVSLNPALAAQCDPLIRECDRQLKNPRDE